MIHLVPSQVEDLAAELLRMGTTLRLNPGNWQAAFADPELQAPLVLAAIRTSDALQPSIITGHTKKNIGNMTQLTLQILYPEKS